MATPTDGDIDGADFLTWQRQVGLEAVLASGHSTTIAAVQVHNLLPGRQSDHLQIQQVALVVLNDGVSVPEPAAVGLLGVGFLGLLGCWRGRKGRKAV